MKHLSLLLALLAGCTVQELDSTHPTDLGAAPPAADDDDDSTDEPTPETPVDAASVLAVSFPELMLCGGSAEATVQLRNDGTATWTRADGYKLGAVDDDDPLKPGDARVWLAEDESVPPGFEFTFVVPLVAPEDAADLGLAPEGGWLTTDWRMVHEGVNWFGDVVTAEVELSCLPDPDPEPLPLPDAYDIVTEMAALHPDWLANSCQDDGGTWQFMDAVVDRLREDDARWGYNWKRGNIGDPSEDVVDYAWGAPPFEESTEVYIIDIIVGHCGGSPAPGFTDVTQATADGGTIGRWTGRGRF